MAKDPIYLAFSTQKGGAGKTTLTVLVASYLHYVKGYDVAVIDCDYPQHSIVEMRGRDLKMAKEDEYSRHSFPTAYASVRNFRARIGPSSARPCFPQIGVSSAAAISSL